MPLIQIPNELLDQIIEEAMPDGFESLALTSKKLFALCSPFIERHERLLEYFSYVRLYDPEMDHTLQHDTSYDLIARIAVEPIVARYIGMVDLALDNSSLVYKTSRSPKMQPFDKDGAVSQLLAKSSFLKQAGLDWKEFYAKIREDIAARRYSQYAAAFLLTLLPNAVDLTLPIHWQPLEATNKLIDTVIRRANRSSLPHDSLSLVKLSSLSLCDGNLRFADPFLGLPHISSFEGYGCRASDDCYKVMTVEAPGRCVGGNFERVNLESCYLNETNILELLDRTHRLKKFGYTQSSPSPSPFWEICKFVAAIEQKVGNHLIELSLRLPRPRTESIAPGIISMRGFQHLRKLRLPLEFFQSLIVGGQERLPTLDEIRSKGFKNNVVNWRKETSLVVNVLPASLTHLTLFSSEIGHGFYMHILQIIFDNFKSLKAARLPTLEEISLCFLRQDHHRPVSMRHEQNEQVKVIWHFTGWWWSYGEIWDEQSQGGYIFRKYLPPDPHNHDREYFLATKANDYGYIYTSDSSGDGSLGDSGFDDHESDDNRSDDDRFDDSGPNDSEVEEDE